jgi:Protein of unknown function (DUF4054)
MSDLYAMPTVDQFLCRYPEFIDVDPARIEQALLAGARRVDDTWIAQDYQPGVMAFAAHTVNSSMVASEGFGQDDLRSISIGPLSLSYGDRISLSELSSTPYGQEYAELLRLNCPAVVVI